MFCVCFHNQCEFIFVSVLLCLDNTISLELSITPGSYNVPTSFFIKVSEPLGQEFGMHIGQSAPKSFTLCSLTMCGSLC